METKPDYDASSRGMYSCPRCGVTVTLAQPTVPSEEEHMCAADQDASSRTSTAGGSIYNSTYAEGWSGRIAEVSFYPNGMIERVEFVDGNEMTFEQFFRFYFQSLKATQPPTMAGTDVGPINIRLPEDSDDTLEGLPGYPDAIEALANLVHDVWKEWMIWQFEQCVHNEPLDGSACGSMTIPAELTRRWRRQIDTHYKDLPGSEKETDRTIARRYLRLLRGER